MQVYCSSLSAFLYRFSQIKKQTVQITAQKISMPNLTGSDIQYLLMASYTAMNIQITAHIAKRMTESLLTFFFMMLLLLVSL